MNTDELIRQICQDEIFREKLRYGLQNGLIEKWDDEFLEKLRRLNVFSGFSFSFLEVFEEGVNVGTCYETSRSLSFLFDDFIINTGYLHALDNTPGAPHGEHAWLEVGDYLYDTTMMLKIHNSYANVLGYQIVSSKHSQEFQNDKYYLVQRKMAFEDNSWYFQQKQLFNDMVRVRLGN